MPRKRAIESSLDEIIELAIQNHASTQDAIRWAIQQERIACVKACINALEFHGFDEAIPYIEWMAENKLGVKGLVS